MSLKSLIQQNYRDHTAIGGFNFYNFESAKAICEAAAQENKPVLLMVSEKSIEYAGFEQIVSVATNLKPKYKQPIFLHLDHGSNLDVIRDCIKNGFDSVMFDGSKLPLEQNILVSRDLRRAAHRKSVVFEAEIGKIAGKEDKVSSSEFKTNPFEAEKFAKEVKPDMLAVAIGNVHGYEVKNEDLDFTLLAKISDMIKIPLVLHGCSNREAREYKVAISQGVVKVNIDTELRQAFVIGITQAVKKRLLDPREILNMAAKEMTKTVTEKIKTFSSSQADR